MPYAETVHYSFIVILRAKETAMATKKKTPKRPAPKPARKAQTAKKRPSSAARSTKSDSRGTGDVKELRARLAAIEHMLVKKEICDDDELLRARQFAGLARGGFAGNDQE
jgi:hypothetical protein